MQGTNIPCHNGDEIKAGSVLMADNCEEGNFTQITDKGMAKEDYRRQVLLPQGGKEATPSIALNEASSSPAAYICSIEIIWRACAALHQCT